MSCLLIMKTSKFLVCRLVHSVELLGRDGIGITPVLVVRDQVVSRLEMSHTFSCSNLSVARRFFRPDGCGFHVATGFHLPIGPCENFAIDRIQITMVIYEPISAFASLIPTPFFVGESFGIQIKLDRGDKLVSSLLVFSGSLHRILHPSKMVISQCGHYAGISSIRLLALIVAVRKHVICLVSTPIALIVTLEGFPLSFGSDAR